VPWGSLGRFGLRLGAQRDTEGGEGWRPEGLSGVAPCGFSWAASTPGVFAKAGAGCAGGSSPPSRGLLESVEDLSPSSQGQLRSSGRVPQSLFRWRAASWRVTRIHAVIASPAAAVPG
jgi:hypothetical protein